MAAFSKLKQYNGLTGKVRIEQAHVIRQMPLMELKNGQPEMVKLLDGAVIR